MSYKSIKKLDDGRHNYEFYAFIKGEKHRKRIKCFSSDVKKEHELWIKNIQRTNRSEFSIFEIFDKYLAYYKAIDKPERWKHRERDIRSFQTYLGKDMPLSDMKRHIIKDYLNWRKDHPLSSKVTTVKPSTIRYAAMAISHLFNFCIDHEYWKEVNPAYNLRISVKNVRRINLDQNQIDEIITKAALQGEILTPVLLSLGCGLRRGEIMKLHWSNIDFETAKLTLPSAYTKSGEERVIVMPNVVVDYLRKLKSENPFTPRVMDGWQTGSKYRFEFNELLGKLSFDTLANGLKLRPHDLRHQYGQSLLDAGMELEDIQKLLGHSSIRVTQERYVHFNNRDIADKVNKLSSVLKAV